jgi:hypothetical protein
MSFEPVNLCLPHKAFSINWSLRVKWSPSVRPSVDWLGVPLKAEEEIIGVLVVQSYTEGVQF